METDRLAELHSLLDELRLTADEAEQFLRLKRTGSGSLILRRLDRRRRESDSAKTGARFASCKSDKRYGTLPLAGQDMRSCGDLGLLRRWIRASAFACSAQKFSTPSPWPRTTVARSRRPGSRASITPADIRLRQRSMTTLQPCQHTASVLVRGISQFAAAVVADSPYGVSVK